MIRHLSTQIALPTVTMPTSTQLRRWPCLSLGLSLLFPLQALAQSTNLAESMGESWDAKFQATTVQQRKPAFNEAYSGPNSLGAARDHGWSSTATLFLGARAWAGGEFYLNPEMAMGLPFSNLTGLGGFTNGELAKTSGNNPTFYRARLFLRQTWNIGAATEAVESEQNQLAGKSSAERWVLTAGNFSAADVFDDNAYSHEPRRQFLNWSIMTHGAWDYPADSRGYTVGAALEYYLGDWALRVGRFMQPKQSNGLALNPRIFDSYGDVAEAEYGYTVNNQPGRVRLLAFRNMARMASYQAALDASAASGAAPDINGVRDKRSKTGYGLNLEQALGKDVGVFLRASRADGRTETFAFAEIDQSISGGIDIKGGGWSRANDNVGLAVARNALSSAHRQYLQQGGLGFFLGDGRLDYGAEQIVEAYYSAALTKNFWLSLNGQRIRNPGYNQARGPVTFYGLRMHIEF